MSYAFTIDRKTSVFLVSTTKGTLVTTDERTAVELAKKFNCGYTEVNPITYSRVVENFDNEMASLVYGAAKG